MEYIITLGCHCIKLFTLSSHQSGDIIKTNWSQCMHNYINHLLTDWLSLHANSILMLSMASDISKANSSTSVVQFCSWTDESSSAMSKSADHTMRLQYYCLIGQTIPSKQTSIFWSENGIHHKKTSSTKSTITKYHDFSMSSKPSSKHHDFL